MNYEEKIENNKINTDSRNKRNSSLRINKFLDSTYNSNNNDKFSNPVLSSTQSTFFKTSYSNNKNNNDFNINNTFSNINNNSVEKSIFPVLSSTQSGFLKSNICNLKKSPKKYAKFTIKKVEFTSGLKSKKDIKEERQGNDYFTVSNKNKFFLDELAKSKNDKENENINNLEYIENKRKPEDLFALLRISDSRENRLRMEQDEINEAMRNLNSFDQKKKYKYDRSQMNTDLLYSNLKNYYSKSKNLQKLSELENLHAISNIRKKLNINKSYNKIIRTFLQKKEGEQCHIFLNNISKTKNKFFIELNENDNKLYIKNELNVDLNSLTESEKIHLKIQFYRNIIREKKKYEFDCRQELVEISYKLLMKKLEKKKLTEKKNELFKLLNDSQKEYKRRMMSLCGINEEKINEEHNINMNVIENNPNPQRSQKKRCASVLFPHYTNYTMDKKIEIINLGNDNIRLNKNLNNLLTENTKQLENINNEIAYFSKIFEQLVGEQKKYYLDILSNGYDFRSEGLVWVVKKLYELKVYLNYSQFPKFLSKDQIEFLCEYAMLSLENLEYRLILNCVKKRENVSNNSNHKNLYKKHFLKNRFYDSKDSKKIRSIKKSLENIADKYFNSTQTQDDSHFEDLNINNYINTLKNSIKFNEAYNSNEINDKFALDYLFQNDEEKKNVINNIMKLREQINKNEEQIEKIINKQIKKFKYKYTEYSQNLQNSVEYDLVFGALFGSNLV